MWLAISGLLFDTTDIQSAASRITSDADEWPAKEHGLKLKDTRMKLKGTRMKFKGTRMKFKGT